MHLSALDENGKPTDWWFLYKVPKMAKDAQTDSTSGYEYVYFDDKAKTVTRSPNQLTDGNGALDLTLASLFKKPDATTGWILYNDEMPASVGHRDSGSLGHTKGVIGFDTATDSGFWLLHSWPKYADPGAAGLPTPMYGQTFMCITINLATANQIASQMANHQQPQVYDPHLPASLASNSGLALLTKPIDPNASGASGSIDCVSKGALKFKVIAKNRDWGQDFWNDLVGPMLKEDMDVETWIRGPIPPVLDSDGIHKTFDMKFIDLRPLGTPWAWPETHDHAKWGITKQDNWICVGDINRMISQEKRGGGTIAFQSAILWSALKKTDLIVAPPGHTVDEARQAVKKTHIPHGATGTAETGAPPPDAEAAKKQPKEKLKKE